ncbi:fimbrial chaperone protein [Klebsiella variicola]|nr:fimbrial chaperone protein [Klebsiella variicola]
MGILQALKKHIRFSCLFLISVPLFTQAGGIVADGTRIVYPSGARQKNITVRNTDDKTTYLVQSWAEDAQGNKTKDFISTPPLFTSAPGNENILRLTRTGGNIPADRESLYYFTVKGIPSVDKNQLKGHTGCIDCLHRTNGVTFNAGDLDLTPNRITGKPEIMLHANFCGDTYLFRTAAGKCGKTSGCHRTGNPHFPLTTHFGTRNGGIHFIECADCTRSQKKYLCLMCIQ